MRCKRLFRVASRRICPPMKFPLRLIFGFLASLATLSPCAPGWAQTHHAAPHQAPSGGPKALGHFEDWTAATHEEAGQTVCYAFTYAANSAPAIPGRPKAVLTVTERPSGRDAVAISAGFTFAPGSEVTVQVEQSALNFYTSGRSAFARDGVAA